MSDDRPRYQHFFRCRCCSHRFSVVRFTSDPAKVKTPKCPLKKCGGKSRESHVPDIGMDVAAGKAPAQVGSNFARAYDYALNVAVEDHGLTDIQDKPYVGENTAPKLRPDLQARADSFWGGGKKKPSQPAMRNMKADLSGLYGERATRGNDPNAPLLVKNGGMSAVEPILRAPDRIPGDSPVPKTQTLASWSPAGSA